MTNKVDLSIIIPVFNESQAIDEVLNKLINFSFPCQTEIIIVDDGSTDETSKHLKIFVDKPGLTVMTKTNNQGYGAALKTGIRHAIGEYIVAYDGDGQFIPEHIQSIWDYRKEHNLPVVFGERQGLLKGSQFWRTPGKFFIRYLVRNLVGIRLKDFNCGLRLVKREVILKYLHLCSDKFSFSTTSTLILISRGYPYDFMSLKPLDRSSGVSTVGVSSGFHTILLIIRIIMLFNPLKIFISGGGVFLLIGVIWGLYYILLGQGLSVGSLLFILIGILLIFLGLIADQIAEIRKSQFENNYII